MSKAKDGQALARLPVHIMSRSASSQRQPGNRVAHLGRDVRGKVWSGVVAAARRSAAGTLAVVTGAGPAVVPDRVNLVVILGLALGVWAIVVRRMVLGLGLILLALAIAGAVALGQEGEHAMHQQTVHVVINRSAAA